MLENLFFFTAILAGALLSVWACWQQKNFMRDYKYTGSYTGKRHEYLVRWLPPNRLTLCMLGADQSGLYILSHPQSVSYVWGYYGYRNWSWSQYNTNGPK